MNGGPFFWLSAISIEYNGLFVPNNPADFQGFKLQNHTYQELPF